jgi:neuropeptide Y receptor
MCKIVPFAATLSVNVSIITLVAISLDRYYVILYPFRQKLRLKQCILILVLIWIVSILMSLFKLLNYDVHTSSLDDDEEFDSITSTSATTTAQMRKVCEPQKEHLDDIETVFLVVMQYIVPFFIISFTYFRIGFHIYFDDSPSSVTQNHSANKKKVICGK